MDDDELHVYPEGDLVEHILEGDTCPCGPTTVPVEREDGSIDYFYSHHSLDGREHQEPNHNRAECPLCSSDATD